MKKLIGCIFLILAVNIGGVMGKEAGIEITKKIFSGDNQKISSKEYLLKIATDYIWQNCITTGWSECKTARTFSLCV